MNCPNCHTEVLQNEGFCSNCGAPLAMQGGTGFQSQPYAPSRPNYDVVPPEINKWNWGAFCFNILWGIGNHAYLTLLCLVPLLNIVWIFVCGASGNKWAWKSGEFKSVDEFLAVQKTWNRAGLVYFILMLIIFALYIVFGALMLAALGNSLS